MTSRRQFTDFVGITSSRNGPPAPWLYLAIAIFAAAAFGALLLWGTAPGLTIAAGAIAIMMAIVYGILRLNQKR